MRFIQFFILASVIFLSACSGEQPIEKAILGTWVQETPVSMTSDGLQTTTADTVLRIKKNGEVHLTRNLDIIGQGLPTDGIKLSLELSGDWEILNAQLKQTQKMALVMPRTSDETTQQWADEFQAQAEQSPPTVKDIIAVNKTDLILQDLDTGTTDIYRRR